MIFEIGCIGMFTYQGNWNGRGM